MSIMYDSGNWKKFGCVMKTLKVVTAIRKCVYNQCSAERRAVTTLIVAPMSLESMFQKL